MSFELPGILIIHFTGFYEKVCKSEKKKSSFQIPEQFSILNKCHMMKL